MYESTAQDVAEELRRSERDRAEALFLLKAQQTASKIRQAKGAKAAQAFLKQAQITAQEVGKAAGDRAATTYLKICCTPADSKAIQQELTEMTSNTSTLLKIMDQQEWWKTTELMAALHWGHSRTSQTIQYLLRKGKIAKSGSGSRVQYRKADSDRGVA